jgi:hypothetical protein
MGEKMIAPFCKCLLLNIYSLLLKYFDALFFKIFHLIGIILERK